MGISCQKIERLLGINLGIHLDPFFGPVVDHQNHITILPPTKAKQ